MEVAASIAVYLGAAFLILVLKKRFRWPALGATLIAWTAAFCWPTTLHKSPTSTTLLDRYAPQYQFHERHEIEIPATRQRVYSAILNTTADEIFLFQTLVWLRRGGQGGPESILNAPGQRPILEVATHTNFTQLAEDPNREIVVGIAIPGSHRLTPEQFIRGNWFERTLAVMAFRMEELGPSRCRLITETRVYAPSDPMRFARYWRLIYPGSSLIRYTWLRAIARRAQREEPRPTPPPTTLEGCYDKPLTDRTRQTFQARLISHQHGLAILPHRDDRWEACVLFVAIAPIEGIPKGESDVTVTGAIHHAHGFRRDLHNGFGYRGSYAWAIEIDTLTIH